MKRSLILLIMSLCLVAALGLVAHAGPGESGGIRPSAFSIKR